MIYPGLNPSQTHPRPIDRIASLCDSTRFPHRVNKNKRLTSTHPAMLRLKPKKPMVTNGALCHFLNCTTHISKRNDLNGPFIFLYCVLQNWIIPMAKQKLRISITRKHLNTQNSNIVQMRMKKESIRSR